MRPLVERASRFARSRPRILPFVPVMLRALVRRRRPAERLPSVSGTSRARSRTGAASGHFVVFAVIRNGITNGYPFVEAFASWLDVCDGLLVVDGESDDGTRDALDELSAIDPRIEIESRPWPQTPTGGSAIAEITNQAVDLARLRGQLLMYVQADEIYTPAQRQLARAHDASSALEFAGCANFWNSFHSVLANEFPMRYMRVLPANAEINALGDGFTFEVDVPVHRTAEQFLHYGWCFPENILRKHVSHGRLYSDDWGYVVRGWLAQRLLEQRRYEPRLLNALAPQYIPVPFAGSHPASVRHLVDLPAYDPNVGLDLLRHGARW